MRLKMFLLLIMSIPYGIIENLRFKKLETRQTELFAKEMEIIKRHLEELREEQPEEFKKIVEGLNEDIKKELGLA